MKKKLLAALCLLALLVGALCLFPHASATPGAIEVGYGKRDITPQASVPLNGYGNTFTRMSAADGSGVTVRMDDNGDGVVDGGDGLFATCIAIRDDEGNVLLWFAHDMIGAHPTLLGKLQTRVTRRWSIPGQNVLLNGSHTHSGPDLSQYFSYFTNSYSEDPDRPGYDADMKRESYDGLTAEEKTAVDHTEQYVFEVLLPGLMGAAEDALADLAPADMYTGAVRVPNLNFIRHYYDTDSGSDPAHVYGDNTTGYSDFKRAYQPANDTMYILEFVRQGKSPVAAVDWRAHPKLNSTATSTFGLAHRAYVSSDYVNAFRLSLEQEGYLPAFFEGTAGNVNTFSDLYKSSKTNYLADAANPTDKDTVRSYTNGSTTQASQIGYLYGQKLATWALQGLTQNMTQAPTGPVTAVSRRVYADYDTHENYKMSGGNGLEGMLFEQVSDRNGVTRTVNDYLDTYYYYKSTPLLERTRLNNILNKYGINSVYHLGRIRSKFNSTMEPDGAGGYVQKENIQGSFVLFAHTIGASFGCVTAPFEIFDDCYGFRGEQFPMTFVLGYSNGSQGYLPTEDVFTFAGGRGCYEANNTAYAPGTAERVAALHEEMLEAMKPDSLPAQCPACGAAATWRPLSVVSELPSGHYYLPFDQEGALRQMNVRSGGPVCIYLNGCQLVNNGTDTSRLFATYAGAELNVIGPGAIQSQGAVITLDEHGQPLSSPFQHGGVIHNNSGSTVNLYDVTVRCRAAAGQWSQHGGAINALGALNVYGGTVELVDPDGVGALTQQGGLVYVGSSGRLHATDAAFTGGAVCSGGQGGAIYVSGSGTAVLDGTSRTEGGVYLASNAALTLAGSVRLLPGEDGALYAAPGARTVDAGGLSEGAEVWITPRTIPQAVATVSQGGQARLFHTQEGGVSYAAGTVSVTAQQVGCPCGGLLENAPGHVCEDGMVWERWTGTDRLPTGGSWYLAGDVTVSSATALSDTLYLDLHGKTITAAGDQNVFDMTGRSRLYLCDLSGGGMIDAADSTSANTGGYGGAIGAEAGTVLVIYGGTVKGSAAQLGGAVYSSGTVQMYGGTITGGRALRGGGVYCTGSLELWGGEISGNEASDNGGGVYASGTFDLCGGAVRGNTAGVSGGGIFVTSGGTLNVLGGDVEENTSVKGGGGVFCAGKMNMLTAED